MSVTGGESMLWVDRASVAPERHARGVQRRCCELSNGDYIHTVCATRRSRPSGCLVQPALSPIIERKELRTVNRKRIRIVVLSLAAAVVLYALLGFLLVPYAAKRLLVSFVERDLGHKLTLGEARFNPFTFKAELVSIDLREPDGGAMFACDNLRVDFEAASLWRRAWTFADIAAQAPRIRIELRPNGRHNFSALLDALRDPEPQPQQPPPRLAIERVAITEGRIDLADPQAGQAARLTLAPIAFELTELTTEASDTAPYKLTARSPDGERIEWNGEVSVNPIASKGRLALQGWNFATLARWLGNRIALERAAGTLDVSFDYDSAFTAGAAAFTMSNLQARLAGLALVNRAASEPFVQLQSLQLSGGKLDLAARNFTIERVELAHAALALEVGADGTGNWSGAIPRAPSAAPGPAPGSTSAPASAPEPAPSSATAPASPSAAAPASTPAPVSAPQPEKPAIAAANAQPWSGRIGQLVVADSAFSYADRRAGSAAEVSAAGIQFETTAQATHSGAANAITLSNIQSAIAKLVLHSGEQQLQGTQAALKAAGVNAQIGASGIALDAKGVDAALASIDLGQGDNRWQVGKADAAIESLRVATSESSSARAEGAGFAAEGTGFTVDGAGFALEANGIAARLGKGAKNAIEIGSTTARAHTVALEPGATNPDVRIDGLTGAIQAALVRDPASGNELLRLKRAELSGAAAAMGKRTLNIEKIALDDVHAAVTLAAEGKSNWDALVAAFGSGATPAQHAQTPPWQVAVNAVELGNLGGIFTDRRQQPPLAVELQQVNARVRNASTEGAKPMHLELNGRIKDSGQFHVAGSVRPRTYAADLKVKLTGLSLAPLQPYAARYARVQIVSALASADGRVRYGFTQAAGANLLFEGELGLDKVIVEETEPAQPLLSIDTLRAAQTRLTLGPDRLEIPDLRLDKLATRLLIAQDRSVNIAKLLRPQAQSTATTANPPTTDAATKPVPPTAGAKPDAAASDAADPFPIVISRLRVDNSVLEFSDLSLTPRFNTRMHELQGVVTGISTAADTRARMELDARVDEFGSAQIRGSMNLFKPKVFTNVDLDFRNLEMTDLTPYAAKFAGYRIASGKLSMDLHYRIKNSQLVGENKIVVDKLELGERVESPTALDLPLELAIAILKDDKGRIDIGLPVSGSLEDPQFNIAAVVWKALGNLLGRIVTAPFRALAAILGGGASADELSVIRFDPGSARIAPPERVHIETVAEALGKRPELKLTVNPTYAPQADREALQSEAVRREVLKRAGIAIGPDESPGPLDYGSSRIRSAIEATFTDAFGFPAARDLRAEVAKGKRKSGAPPPASGSGETKPSAEPGTAPKPDTSADAAGASVANAAADAAAKPAPSASTLGDIRVARAMVRRLIEARPVEDSALTELARRRGDAIAEALRANGKIDPARLGTAAPRAIETAPEDSVATNLDLGVVKQ
jgi:uncharacterized protein involved in outer membrane biogenesis